MLAHPANPGHARKAHTKHGCNHRGTGATLMQAAEAQRAWLHDWDCSHGNFKYDDGEEIKKEMTTTTMEQKEKTRKIQQTKAQDLRMVNHPFFLFSFS